MSDYIVPRSVKRLEDEIAELEKNVNGSSEDEEIEQEETEEVEETSEAVEEAPVTKEEETFKKRYSDLRRHSQGLADKVKELEAALKTQKTSPGLPTAEEAEEWAKANPKAAAIIRAIAMGEATSTSEEINTIKDKLNRAEQEARIFKVHPDFEDVTSEEQFHDWAEQQPQSVQKLIYSNSADDVIWAIGQYKKEKTEKPNHKKEAAKAVSSKTSFAEPKTEGKGRFTESMISKMSMSEYEKNEAAIQESMRNGTFIYDLSGAAR